MFFSCPEQLNNWHCLSVGRSVPWSEPTNYNHYNLYNLYNLYNHYRDKDSDLDLDLDWGVVIYNQIVTWTAFAILAMFYSCLPQGGSLQSWSIESLGTGEFASTISRGGGRGLSLDRPCTVIFNIWIFFQQGRTSSLLILVSNRPLSGSCWALSAQNWFSANCFRFMQPTYLVCCLSAWIAQIDIVLLKT